jgi:spoIIIJ-associated protein
VSVEVTVEATGETVGEAKWAALRELERKVPGLDKSTVHFDVVSEGERGLLGVGFAPARVTATATAGEAAVREPGPGESELAADVRGLMEQIVFELGVQATVEVRESDEGLYVSCSGADLGVLIGRFGQTIDAVQYLLNAIVARREGARIEVTVDAAGYRERRRAILEALALESAERAIESREPVELDPMTAVERKVVHLRLQDHEGVETSSEGTEPNRFVVISPT